MRRAGGHPILPVCHSTPRPTPPTAPPRTGAPAPRPIALWLLAVAGMVWAMVALGGATRLTGSGLSIMEWAPLSGSLPPLSEAEWRRLYALYQTIPQYALVNQGFGLEGFKEIFWLEWAHRLWGRLIGLAYALPLAWFWLRGRIPAGLKPRLLLLLLLGGLQGAVGWFMVASGFEADRTAVSPYRLVMHLSLALGLYAALLWTGLTLLRPPRLVAPAAAATVRRQAKAAAGWWWRPCWPAASSPASAPGFDYNTFPLMDGQLVPDGYWRLEPAWRNLTLNIPAVQFNHRLLATLATLAALGAAVAGWRRLPPGAARAAPASASAPPSACNTRSASPPCCWWCRPGSARCTRPAPCWSSPPPWWPCTRCAMPLAA